MSWEYVGFGLALLNAVFWWIYAVSLIKEYKRRYGVWPWRN